MYFYKNKQINFSLIDYRYIEDSEKYWKFISEFYIIFINGNNTRNNSIILKKLIYNIEKNCIEQNCILKKCLINLEKGEECQFLLLEYLEYLFNYGISKYNDNINLKCNYIIFLILEMNNTKKALLLLKSIEDNNILSFGINFSIYHCKKFIDNFPNLFIKENNFLNKYKNNINNFKDLISKFILLYYRFVLLLIKSKMKSNNSFSKINIICNQIINSKKEIENTFNKLKNIKANNTEIIKLYSIYCNTILDESNKNENIFYNDNFLMNEIDYSNINIKSFNEKDNSYLIISVNKDDLGIIIDSSINASKILGYQKNEIIGKEINILIPSLFHQKHNSIFLHQYKRIKLNYFKNIKFNKNLEPLKKEVFSISKSKFLIPINLDIYPSITEKNNFVYFVKISDDIPMTLKADNNEERFYILTDKHFLIETFTPNCLNFLI